MASDGLMVPTVELLAVVLEWADRHDRVYGAWTRAAKNWGRNKEADVFCLSGAGYVCEWMQLSPDWMTKLKQVKHEYTMLRTADKVLTLIGEPDALHDGRVTIWRRRGNTSTGLSYEEVPVDDSSYLNVVGEGV